MHVEINSRATECPNTAAVQFAQIRDCLKAALAHRRYELLARVRPDFYFSPSFGPLPFPTHSGHAAAPALAWAIDAFNMDCLFVLSAAAAEEFVAFPVNMDGRSLEFPTCGGGNNLDTEHPLFRGALPAVLRDARPLRIPWRTQINQSISRVWGGLVRSQRTLRVPTDIDWARLKADLETQRAQFRCAGPGDDAAEDARPFQVYNHPFGKGDLTRRKA